MLSVIVLHISYIIYHTKYRMQGRALPSRAWTYAIKTTIFSLNRIDGNTKVDNIFLKKSPPPSP